MATGNSHRYSSASKETLRSLALPRIPEEAFERPSVDAGELHSNRRESLAPPDAFTGPRPAVNGCQDAALVEHDVHVVVVPLRSEDPARDTEGRTTVMILLDRLRETERELPCLFA